MPQIEDFPSALCPNKVFRLLVDFLEFRVPVGLAKLPDSRLAHATEPGQVRVQWQLRLPAQAGFHETR